MKFGLEDRHWRKLCELLIDPLKERGAEVWIFGSRASGAHRSYSDIDVLVVPPKDFPPTLIGQVQEALEESDLPYKVDLVKLEDLAESYRENVLRQRVRV